VFERDDFRQPRADLYAIITPMMQSAAVGVPVGKQAFKELN
jgi:hypothetical protein